MDSDLLHHYTVEFGSGRDLRIDDAEIFFDAVISERDESILDNLLTEWIAKGHTEDELISLATVMRSRMKRIDVGGDVVDIVGTGGSHSKTFNVSTAAAFVAAGAGLKVAKHGNRAATSTSGSADVLELLGIRLDILPEDTIACLNDIGICFMFAPCFHSLSPVLGRVRRGLGKPTIFNNLGPICNPAGATHQLIGVWAPDVLEKTAKGLSRLGSKRSWVVHGGNGLDEISVDTVTHVAQIEDGNISYSSVSLSDFGCRRGPDDVPKNLSTEHSAIMIAEIFDNKHRDSAAETLVLVNAAAAIYIAGKATDLPSAFEIARASIRSGAAKAKVDALAHATNK